MDSTHIISASNSDLQKFTPKLKVKHRCPPEHSNKPSILVCFQNTKFLICYVMSEDLILSTISPGFDVEVVDVTHSNDNIHCASKSSNGNDEVEVWISISTLIHMDNKLTSVKGTLDIMYEPSEEAILNISLERSFSLINLPTDSKTFILKCKGRDFIFKKQLLMSSSEVFNIMVNNTSFTEGRCGYATLEFDSPNTVSAFQEIMDGKARLDLITSDLLLFADKYQIIPLIKISLDHLMSNITEDNVLHLIYVADELDNDDLLKAAVTFMYDHKNCLHLDAEQLEELASSKPSIFFKIFKKIFSKAIIEVPKDEDIPDLH